MDSDFGFENLTDKEYSDLVKNLINDADSRLENFEKWLDIEKNFSILKKTTDENIKLFVSSFTVLVGSYPALGVLLISEKTLLSEFKDFIKLIYGYGFFKGYESRQTEEILEK